MILRWGGGGWPGSGRCGGCCSQAGWLVSRSVGLVGSALLAGLWVSLAGAWRDPLSAGGFVCPWPFRGVGPGWGLLGVCPPGVWGWSLAPRPLAVQLHCLAAESPSCGCGGTSESLVSTGLSAGCGSASLGALLAACVCGVAALPAGCGSGCPDMERRSLRGPLGAGPPCRRGAGHALVSRALRERARLERPVCCPAPVPGAPGSSSGRNAAGSSGGTRAHLAKESRSVGVLWRWRVGNGERVRDGGWESGGAVTTLYSFGSSVPPELSLIKLDCFSERLSCLCLRTREWSRLVPAFRSGAVLAGECCEWGWRCPGCWYLGQEHLSW